MKNETRMESLLGTWTAQTHIKARLGPYEMFAYIMVHLMPDPMRSYGCQLDGCSEVDNQVCIERDDRQHSKQECLEIPDNVVEWSDVAAFIYFGAHADAGIPFNIHTDQNLGGWVGPFNLILAQESVPNNDSDGVLDRYVTRYLSTPSTPYLHMPPNCTLMDSDDFDQMLGTAAVNHTTHQQAQPYNASDDPYGAYLKTCKNGDVQPILPLIDFTFVQGDDQEEQIQVRLNYKILATPYKGDILYKLFPTFQRHLNRRKAAFHISGPYCYGNDPHRAYSFDFHYDSKQETDLITLVHGCVEGLPCVPPALSATGAQGTDMIRIHTKVATLGGDMEWILLVVVLMIALIISCACQCRQRRFLRGMMRNRRLAAAAENNDLSQPLLSEEEGGPEQPTDEEEHKEESKVPEVAFV